MPAELEEAFGDEVLDHTLVLLTCGDYLMGRTVEVLELYTRYKCQVLLIFVFLKSGIHVGTLQFKLSFCI